MFTFYDSTLLHSMVLNFSEYDEIQKLRQMLFDEAADSIIAENIDALVELAG